MAVQTMTDGAGLPIGAGRVANVAGAVMSLALMIGVAVWGYKLFVRDVTGIPVVRAVDGPMRQAPDNPGGTIASHQGLAVNEIAAVGVASGPQDALMLAPGALDLSGEDIPSEELTPVVETAEVAEPSDGPATGLTAPMIVEAYGLEEAEVPSAVETAATQSVAAVDPIQAVLEAVVLDVPASMIVPASVPGVVRSERPRMRPAGARLRPARAEAPSAAAPVSADAVPVGAHLIQLGAYDSEAVAKSEWTRLSGRFSDYLTVKSPVIQEAERGGRTFYRLRAAGFEDMSDARRLCSALKAAGADCIPVVAR
ncbi:SPOR domain-containing protein [Aestuariibius insulae]|uniref:SPOR domain-containing protein n=1 Tax=Aestuariibius insulae TaxID=2058287 RepID=UPI00345ED691